MLDFSQSENHTNNFCIVFSVKQILIRHMQIADWAIWDLCNVILYSQISYIVYCTYYCRIHWADTLQRIHLRIFIASWVSMRSTNCIHSACKSNEKATQFCLKHTLPIVVCFSKKSAKISLSIYIPVWFICECNANATISKQTYVFVLYLWFYYLLLM